MSSPSSPTLDEVIEKIMEDVQVERVEQPENQETTPTEEVREEIEEVEGDSRGAEKFLTYKGVEIFKKTLAKKGFIGDRGFKELVPPFKEKIERRGWELLCKHLDLGRRTLVKEFYANLGDRKNLTCYIRGRWVSFGERALSQWFKFKEREDCSKFEKLKKNPQFEEIAKELTGGQGEWQSTQTISHAYINKGDLTKIGKVWFYFINSVLKPSMHVSTVRQDCAVCIGKGISG